MFSRSLLRTSLVRNIKIAFSPRSGVQNSYFSTKFGYECASRINGDYDSMFFEKSIRNGCNMVIGKSGEHSEQIYDLLYDLSDSDSIELSNFTIGHVLKFSSNKQSVQQLTADSFQVSEWKGNLDNVRKIIKKRERDLDFVTVQLPLLQFISHTDGDVGLLVTEFNEYFSNTSTTKFGFDFDSNFFVSSTDLTFDKLVALLQPLVDNKQIGALTIASNYMTNPISQALHAWGRQQGLLTVATDVMRADHVRPGTLPTNFRHSSDHTPLEPDGKSKVHLAMPTEPRKRDERMVADIVEATADFAMAMDRCLQVEKKYLSELAPKSPKTTSKINPTTVCLAHVLTAAYDQILYADEWSNCMTKEIEPKFNEASARLSSASQALGDWVALYKVMLKYLLSSYRNLLQKKTLHLSQNAQDIIESRFPELRSENGVEGISRQMALLVAGNTRADFVTVAFTQVNCSEYQELWDEQFEEQSKRPDFKENAAKTFKEIKSILVEYNYSNKETAAIESRTQQ